MQLGIEIKSDVKNDIEALKKLRVPWWLWLFAVICGFLGSSFFDAIGRESLALPTLNCIMVVVFIVILKWRLRRYMWFWAILTIVAALHVLLLLYVPWTEKWVPALAISVIDIADLIVILAAFSLAGRLMGGTKAS